MTDADSDFPAWIAKAQTLLNQAAAMANRP
jgi:hypothetical protein